jgi:hypothetical protein
MSGSRSSIRSPQAETESIRRASSSGRTSRIKTAAELKALRRLADELLSYGNVRIDKALEAKELIEVVTDDE